MNDALAEKWGGGKVSGWFHVTRAERATAFYTIVGTALATADLAAGSWDIRYEVRWPQRAYIFAVYAIFHDWPGDLEPANATGSASLWWRSGIMLETADQAWARVGPVSALLRAGPGDPRVDAGLAHFALQGRRL